MANVIWDYPVKYAYGNVPGYDGFHTGEDRPAPVGTPVPVNGVAVGLVGATGEAYDAQGNRNTPGAAHLHVDRYLNGTHTNPQGGGKTVAGAVVVAVAEDARNGKYVHVQDADGSRWGYRHLSKQLVTVGQKLEGKGDEVPPDYQPVTDGDVINWLRWAKQDPNYQPKGEELDHYKAKGWKVLAEDVRVSLPFDVSPEVQYEQVGTIDGQPIYRKK